MSEDGSPDRAHPPEDSAHSELPAASPDDTGTAAGTDTTAIPTGPRSWHSSALLDRARPILRGASATPGEVLELASALKSRENRFSEARRLLARARAMPTDDDDLRRKLRQQQALCTYKDPNLPVEKRLDRALEILRECEDLSRTDDQETLGIAGAVYKRKWDVEGRREHLERSLALYLAGYEVGPEKDQGYTGINAAYVLDLLAEQEVAAAPRSGEVPPSSGRAERAREIREDLVSVLPSLLNRPDTEWLADQWWFYATVAESFFGLERYGKALEWLKKGRERAREVPEWELQSTVTQLARLARIRTRDLPPDKFRSSEAFRVLSEFMGNNTAAALTGYVGKVGLALSGGGFRASLFHIGVLARLAEADLLRHVEVLSCVSGGSILGAHYYLELRRLLQEKEDGAVTRDDYVELVRKVERDFLAGVQKNIRTRIVGEFVTNLKMIFLPSYSRTMRAGELFERFLYDRVKDERGNGAPWAPWRRYRRWLTDLYIVPEGEGEDFRPAVHNWRRRAKVPVLILNATTLNTGRNWQFTASWMGEPPTTLDGDVEANPRLRRMYYWQAPKRYQRVRLGYAVAASASVPGLFEPIAFPGLYPERTVRLVDGGVFDNQGIGGLLDHDCNVLLVSDASGQMEAESNPAGGVLGTSLRSNSILMSRVRGEQYEGMLGHHRAGLLRGLMFLHLKQDLHADPVDWVDCQEPHEASEEARSASERGVLTRYGVHREMQRRLAAVRTDLDSFSEAEAYALMTSGYRMAEKALREEETLGRLAADDGEHAEWDFLKIEPALQEPPGSRPLGRILEVAGSRAFKVWKLSPLLKVVGSVLAAAAAAGLAWLLYAFSDHSLVTVGGVGWTLLTLVVGAVVGKWAVRALRAREWLVKAGAGALLALVGPLAVRVHLWIFDRLYLRLGKLNRVRPEPEAKGAGDGGRASGRGPSRRERGGRPGDTPRGQNGKETLHPDPTPRPPGKSRP